VVLIRTDVSEEYIASIIKVKEIIEQGTLALIVLQLLVTANGLSSLILFTLKMGVIFLRNVGSYKSHTASQPRGR
jgi:hypothetical protein